MIKQFILIFFLSFTYFLGQSQTAEFTLDDTLRGTVTAERAWWDLTFYDLKVKVNPSDSSIVGENTIRYKVLSVNNLMQIDLQPPLSILAIFQDGEPLNFAKKGRNAYTIKLKSEQKIGAIKEVIIKYAGKPQVAKRAPWDGGFSWKKDANGNPFIATSCQGLGASIWWPCKDHMYDEPDSQAISITVPRGLTDISNGRLRKKTENADGTTTFDWFVSNPINNYGININIGKYEHFSDTFNGEKGLLTLDFYCLPENLAKAKKQFQQVKLMLRAFEHWFGPYPFYEDGYKLVEVPYLGMEHQSSVTYGNGYENGYRGRDLSATGWGLKWDFIIVHESGHEWFANNITYKDIADMWVHESFTNYSENLFTEFHYGKEAGGAYVRGCRKLIANKNPIIGKFGVNNEPSDVDQYYKGGNMLHTIRQVINNDEKWRSILRGLNRDFYHQTVDGRQIETYVSQMAGINLSKVFDQYLRNTQIPVLEYRFEGKKLAYRWTNCIANFDMPVKIQLKKDVWTMVYPTTQWKKSRHKLSNTEGVSVDENFYIEIKKL